MKFNRYFVSELLYSLVFVVIFTSIITSTPSLFANTLLLLAIPFSLAVFSAIQYKYTQELYVTQNTKVQILVLTLISAMFWIMLSGYFYWMGLIESVKGDLEATLRLVISVFSGYLVFTFISIRNFRATKLYDDCMISYKKSLSLQNPFSLKKPLSFKMPFILKKKGIVHLTPEQNTKLLSGASLSRSDYANLLKSAMMSADDDTQILVFESHLLINFRLLNYLEKHAVSGNKQWTVDDKRMHGILKAISSYIMLVSVSKSFKKFRRVHSMTLIK